MHPRFIEFIERLAERPHVDRQMIAMGSALFVTAILITGRFMLFPLQISAESVSQVANVSDSFNSFKKDIGSQAAGIQNQIQTVTNTFSGSNPDGTNPATPVIPLTGDGTTPASEGWAPAADGGGYYQYEYPSAGTEANPQTQSF